MMSLCPLVWLWLPRPLRPPEMTRVKGGSGRETGGRTEWEWREMMTEEQEQ
jgi:hypothetical protein